MWAALVIATASTAGIVWWRRRARHVYVIDHVKLEMHPLCVVEDRVAEKVWRAAISMTNTSRRPRLLPVLAERAGVHSGRYVFLANVYLDAEVEEVSPRQVELAWVEYVLADGERARTIVTSQLRCADLPRSRRWAVRSSANDLRREIVRSGPSMRNSASAGS